MLTAGKKSQDFSSQPDNIHKDVQEIPAAKNIRILFHRDINNDDRHTKIYKETNSSNDWWIN